MRKYKKHLPSLIVIACAHWIAKAQSSFMWTGKTDQTPRVISVERVQIRNAT